MINASTINTGKNRIIAITENNTSSKRFMFSCQPGISPLLIFISGLPNMVLVFVMPDSKSYKSGMPQMVICRFSIIVSISLSLSCSLVSSARITSSICSLSRTLRMSFKWPSMGSCSPKTESLFSSSWIKPTNLFPAGRTWLDISLYTFSAFSLLPIISVLKPIWRWCIL